MATITVNLYANLREYAGGAASIELDIEPEQTVKEVIAGLGIPA